MINVIINVLIMIYIILCIFVMIHSGNKLTDKEFITRGNLIIYIIFLPGLFFGLLVFLLIELIFFIYSFIEKHRKKICSWWNTPIKK